MSAGLYGSAGGANHQIKKLYVNVGGVNREIKELWAVKDGVNRKIFSSQKVMGTTKYYDDSSALWRTDGSGKLYTLREKDTWGRTAAYVGLQFDPGILIPAGQNIFDADITIEYRWHRSSVYGNVKLFLAVNNGSYESLYSREEFTSQDPWTKNIVKSAAGDIVVTNLSLEMSTYLHGTGNSGEQSSMTATWSSGGIRIAGKPVTEVIVS